MCNPEPPFVKMDWDEVRAIEKEGRAAIDSSWHFNWHWDKDAHGYLTMAGWDKALADGEELLAGFRVRAAKLEAFLSRFKPIVEKLRQRETWLKWDNEHAEAEAENEPAGTTQGD